MRPTSVDDDGASPYSNDEGDDVEDSANVEKNDLEEDLNQAGEASYTPGLQKVFFSLRAQNFILKNRSGYSQNSLHFLWFLTNFNSNSA